MLWSSPWEVLIGGMLPLFGLVLVVEMIVSYSWSSLSDATDDD
jgi:hypothetical protein